MDSEDNKTGSGPPRFDGLAEYFEQGKAFMQELMKENERLRLLAAKLGHENDKLRSRAPERRLHELEADNRRLKQLLEELEARFGEVEQENFSIANRYVEVQSQNDNLLNLYVASYQLHSTLDTNEIINIIQEIILNLIGAEEYCIYMLDPRKRSIMIQAGEGPDGPVRGGSPAVIDQTLACVLEAGRPYLRPLEEPGCPHLACIPLKVKDDVVGAISIRKLMPQKKDGLTAIDHELLGLLADHAATALLSSSLYLRTERRLKAVEGFLDILRPQEDTRGRQARTSHDQ